MIRAASEQPRADRSPQPSALRFSRILVPLDGTEFAESALRPAGEIASKLGASLHLVTIVRGTPAKVDAAATALREPVLDPEDHAALGEYLSEIRDRVRVDWSCPVFKAVLADVDSADGVVDYAKRIQADLIIAATHSKSLITRALVGSTAADLVRRAPCPLLLVPGHDETEDGGYAMQVAPTSVVAALDPSGDSDDTVLGCVRACHELWEPDFELVQVLQGTELEDAVAMESRPVRGEPTTSNGPVRDRLGELVASLNQDGLTARAHVLSEARPADAIADFAESRGADVVIVGRHEKGLLERILIGSESARLARRARSVGVLVCPIPSTAEE